VFGSIRDRWRYYDVTADCPKQDVADLFGFLEEVLLRCCWRVVGVFGVIEDCQLIDPGSSVVSTITLFGEPKTC
jgi:hypothetical protein